MSNIFENINTICFTGPRPAKLYGYTKKEEYQKIVDQIKEMIRGFAKFGIKNYITGGAQGFDQLAFWAVNSLKKEYDIQNIVYIPFQGQEHLWKKAFLSKSWVLLSMYVSWKYVSADWKI